MEIQLSEWKSCGISISFPCSTVLTLLTAVKVFVIVLCNTHSTGMLLCCSTADAAERAAERAAKLGC